jgi:iron complex outermembrane recepter protein
MRYRTGRLISFQHERRRPIDKRLLCYIVTPSPTAALQESQMSFRVLFTAIAMTLGAGGAAAQSETHEDVIVVRALPLERSVLESVQPVGVLTGEQLDDRRGVTLGDTLQRELGVHNSYYGPGAGRPIIRGLGGPRVRVLEDGLATGDLAAQSDDHAVAADPMLFRQVEVLRGPATLLYGSGASGGIVNVIDDRIPEQFPDAPFEARAEVRGDSAANERSGVLRLGGGAGSIAWHADGTWRQTDDYRIPGEARIRQDDDHDGSQRLENSFVEKLSGTLGLSWIGERGFVGGSFRTFDSEYGIPTPHGEDDQGHDGDLDTDDGEFVYADARQRRWDLKGGLHDPLPGFNRATMRFSYTDYSHSELPLAHDNGDHGADVHETHFDLRTVQSRIQLEHAPINGWTGVLGLQLEQERFSSAGTEVFAPDGRTRMAGLFVIEERAFGPLTVSVGGRVEGTRVRADELFAWDPGHDQDDNDEGLRRSFTTWSASLGGIWQPDEQWRVALNYSRAQRAPSHAELFALGPHAATFSFEIGEPHLRRETTNGWDLGVHYDTRVWGIEVNLFHNDIDDFVYLEPTGEQHFGLPVRQTRQADARLTGFETRGIWHLHDTVAGTFDLWASYDAVRGRLRDGGNLPRISPQRLGLGVDWRHPTNLRGGLDGFRVLRQDRVAAFETSTPGYHLLGARVSYGFDFGGMGMEAFLRAENLTNEVARVHTSYLKEYAPLPGRNFIFGLRGRF